MIGETLSHYRITGLLGKGGMGEVYRAEDTKLGRRVALKVLPAALAADPARLSRFAREAKAVAGLNHPNIVTLHSVDEADGVHFLTMELVDGKPLAEILAPGGLPLERILALAVPMTDAVAAAHGQGVVHRDLKPGNVMVATDGERVKVLDFGLAKLTAADRDDLENLDTLTRSGAGGMVGTPSYMAPEQARGEDVDQRADVFALGVILFEMATGERPFRGASVAELLSAVLRDQPRPLTDSRPDLPQPLAAIIARCLAKAPDDRYPSAHELCADLRALEKATASGILPPGAAAGGAGSESRARRTAPLLVAMAATVAAVAILLFWIPKGQDAPSPDESDRRIVAVLPFENLGEVGDEYFADGITDEITSRLARIQDLGVISRRSARAYQGTRKTVREIGHELNADYLLAGTIRWDRSAGPGRVRITPHLIRVSDDTHVWSDSYERAVTEIFSLQAEIASRIAAALDITLLATERTALNARPTESIEAYQAYLQGMKQLNAPGFSRDSFALGVQMFERAVELDPDFALALARLASMNARMHHYGFDRSAARLEQAKQAVDRALALEPGLAEAHLALGHYYYWGERDYDRALTALGAASGIDPNNHEIWLTTAYVKRRQGDLEGAVEDLERYRDLSPRDPNAFVALGESYGTLRHYDAAEDAFRRAVALAPDDPYPYTELALVHLRRQGETAAARAALAGMPPVGNSESCRVGFLIELLDRDYAAALERLASCPDRVLEAGAFFTPIDLARGMTRQLMQDREAARADFAASLDLLEAKLAEEPGDHRVHGALGLTYAGLGRTEDAIRHGRRAVELYPLEMDALEAPVQIINLALVFTMVGEQDAALEQLDRALSIPSILSTAWLEADPRWDPLRESPEFAALLRKHRPGT